MSAPNRDARCRFLIETCDVRGELLQLADSRERATANTDYPPVVDRLLGEAFVAAVLLAGTIKFDGKMTFQVRGEGDVHLLVVQVNADAQYRGLARWTSIPEPDATLGDIFGADARLTITIEARLGAEPYQGIVPLEGDSLADAIASYFRASEQLPTQLILDVSTDVACGLLLQRLPMSEANVASQIDEDEGWQRATALADTLESGELAHTAPEVILHRLYHEERVRVFDADTPVFHCGCSRARTDAMLAGLGQKEVESIIAERGAVDIDCEFCDANYRYDAVDVAALFNEQLSDVVHPDSADAPPTRH